MKFINKNRLTGIFTVSALVFMLWVSASAETLQTGDFEITSAGVFEDVTEPCEITIDVYAPGKTYMDLLQASPEDYNKIIVYRNELTSTENGGYEFVFEPSIEMAETIKSGKYTACISATGKDGVICEEFIYTHKGENADVLAMLEEYAKNLDYESFKGVFGTKLIALGFDEKYFTGDTEEAKQARKNQISKIMYETIVDDVTVISDREKAINTFKISVLIAKLNYDECDNLLKQVEEMGLTLKDCQVYPYLEKDYVTDEFGENISKRLAGKNFSDKEEFYKKLTENFVCLVASSEDGYGNIKEILKALQNETGINAEKLSDKVYSNLAGKEYESYEMLKKEISRLKELYSSSGSNGGGSGGSGGGGGSSSGGSSSKENPVIKFEVSEENDVPEKMNKDIFEDLESVAWAQEAITALAEKGILKGKCEALFCPNDNVTREEFAKMLVLTFGFETENSSCDFIDVDKNSWYYPYVSSAYENKIVNGVSENKYGTGDAITRQDLAVMAYRTVVTLQRRIAMADTTFKFKDDAAIAQYAKEAVYTLKTNGVINGVNKIDFAPTSFATRAEAAKILYLLMQM